MGEFVAVCEKCGVKLIYQYDDNDADIGKIKIKKTCWKCLDKINNAFMLY